MCEKSEDGPNNSACSGKTERWKVLKKEKKYQFSRNVQCVLMGVTKTRKHYHLRSQDTRMKGATLEVGNP